MVVKIYRQEAIKAIKEVYATFQIVGQPGLEKYQDEVRMICREMADRYIKAIEDVPAADETFLPEYEKVVRCKNCIHSRPVDGHEMPYCMISQGFVSENGYCDYGHDPDDSLKVYQRLAEIAGISSDDVSTMIAFYRDFERDWRKRQPLVVTAKWEKIAPPNIYQCSKCGTYAMTGDISKYRHCHGCGTKMEVTE